MKIYLYLKTHKSGLRYLGKTVQNPLTYKGSGKHWLRHLRKYGNEVKTEILFESESKEEIKYWGSHFSNLWNITENPIFANIVPEMGDGGNTSNCENYIEGIKKRDTSGPKNGMYGKSAVNDLKLKWYNNGVENIYVSENTAPEGFFKGRIINYKKPHTQETKDKISEAVNKPCIFQDAIIFQSASEAAKIFRVSRNTIYRWLKEKNDWKYL